MSDNRRRWLGARAYARRQGCDEAVACDYADHIAELVRTGEITLPAPHAALYAAWLRANGC